MSQAGDYISRKTNSVPASRECRRALMQLDTLKRPALVTGHAVVAGLFLSVIRCEWTGAGSIWEHCLLKTWHTFLLYSIVYSDLILNDDRVGMGDFVTSYPLSHPAVCCLTPEKED